MRITQNGCGTRNSRVIIHSAMVAPGKKKTLEKMIPPIFTGENSQPPPGQVGKPYCVGTIECRMSKPAKGMICGHCNKIINMEGNGPPYLIIKSLGYNGVWR